MPNPQPYDVTALANLYSLLKADHGVTAFELRALVGEMSAGQMSVADVNAYRQGRRPWKRLHDEVVPVMHFITKEYPPEVRVRFPLNDGVGDAFVWIEGQPPVGIEVTGALARSEVEVAKNLAEKGVVSGLLGLQDDAPQSLFDEAKQRVRLLHSSAAVAATAETGIRRQLRAKDRQQYEGFILLVRCSLSSSPGMSEGAWRDCLGSEADALPFSQVYLVDAASGKTIFRLK